MAIKNWFLGLLLIILAGMLTAQPTPLRLGGRAFVLPSGWPQTYEPPEVLIRVKVNADSTLGLVSVLDGKTELESLLRQHLLTFAYIPSGDSLAEFDAILDILPPPDAPTLQSKQERTSCWRRSRLGSSKILPASTSALRRIPRPRRRP